MCPPKVFEVLSDSVVSRRSLLKYGLGAAAAAVAAVPVSSAQAVAVKPTSFRNVMDLTHVLGPGMPSYTETATFKFRIEQTVSYEKDGYYGNTLTYWEHNGTHMDAPVHFAPKGLFVDQIAPEALIVPAAVIDIGERAARDPDTVVTPDDIRAWERRYGRIPDNAAVLMSSNWATRIGRTDMYRNPDGSGVMHFPGFGKEAIDLLLAERKIAGIGVDTLSLDHGASTTFAVHSTFLATNRWGLENLANLNGIPPVGATLIVGAPKVASGSGGPSRVLAVW